MSVPVIPSAVFEGEVPSEAGRGREMRSLGRYRLLRRVGAGGMSTVYLGYDEIEGRSVAIKVLPDRLAGEPAFLERFRREGRLAELLRHPNLVRGLFGGQDPATGKHYFVMEHVEGPTCEQLIEARGRLPVGHAVRAACDVGEAVDYLHRHRYFHRDIKPSNILIHPDGRALLIDLGLVKAADESPMPDRPDLRFGTPHYMPYEQSLDAGSVDGRGDVFALAATLYHMVTGQVPFQGSDPADVFRRKARDAYVPLRVHDLALPDSLDSALRKAMRRDPEDRYQNTRAFVEALRATGLAALPGPWPAQADFGRGHAAGHSAESNDNPTRLDLPAVPPEPQEGDAAPAREQEWVVRYRRGRGAWRSRRASTSQVRRWSASGRLDEDATASRGSERQFRPVRSYPEFADLVEPAGRPRGRASWVLLAVIGLGLSLCGCLAAWEWAGTAALCRPPAFPVS